MKIAEVNMVDYGSTGNIMFHIAECAREHGHEVRTFSKKWKKQKARNEFHTFYGSTLENGLHVIASRAIGFQGMFSYFGTKQLVSELKQFKPDILHLHNLHDSSTCLPVLFDYIKEANVKTVWTLHDCWAFTGQCPYFTTVKCNKWINGCHNCPQRAALFPFDCSKVMWKEKKKLFARGVDLTLVTPSEWLKGLVEMSFLKNHPVYVINNGIDLNVFHPVEVKDKCDKVVLGVAMGWGERKGLDIFLRLAERLPDSYQIVMVGTDDEVDKLLPKRITSIHRTHNQIELAKIYSGADVFVNPTREDNFPTTNIESLASGTPVITFKTGGSPEIIDETCGSVVECDDTEGLVKEIIRVCETHPYSREACVKRSTLFNNRDRFGEYIKLYENIQVRV